MIPFQTYGLYIGIMVVIGIAIGLSLYFRPKSLPELPMPNTEDMWCFIREDYVGRTCAKVQSKESCVSNRIFRTELECTQIQASHMPAGIIRDDGQFQPLESMKFHDFKHRR